MPIPTSGYMCVYEYLILFELPHRMNTLHLFKLPPY